MPDNTTTPHHKAGFVNIVGMPNVGKSTLMNFLVGEQLAIVTNKAQTTRQRLKRMYPTAYNIANNKY